jgi:diguanylate cyclase (GGDEF)-like protein
VEALDAIVGLAEQLPARRSLDELLQLIADRSAAILGVSRVSVRLLDPARSRLIAVARAGQPLHERPVEFVVGEGLLGWIVEHNRSLCLADPESDPRFAARPGMARMGSFVGVPIRAGAQCSGVLSAVDDQVRFDAGHERWLALIAAMCGPYVEISRLERLSAVDPLTGSLNRRGLDDAFPEVRGGPDGGPARPLSVVIVDIDHFKKVNDEHGHAAGDLVLRHVATVLGGVLRAGDAVVRYGGEEFLLVLPEVTRAVAARVAERARAAIAATPASVAGSRLPVTISLGVAERRDGEERVALIARADEALYRAKHGGRNRVALAD